MNEVLTVLAFALSIVVAFFWKLLFDSKKALRKAKEESRELDIENIREAAAARDIDTVVRDANERWSKRRKD